MNIVQLRLLSISLAAVITVSIVYLAFTQKFSAITDIFSDLDAIKVEVEEKKPPPPPPPPPKDRPPPPPPPPIVQRETPPTPTAAPVPTELPVAPAPQVSVITNPTWLERPSGRDFARYYPERALERERTGRVVLDCVVAADGRIGCGVASEDPTGWGFGEAAVRISRSFRMSPRMENGAPTEGGRVRVPINFRLE